MKSYGLAIQITATEWYSISCGTIHFHYKVVLTFQFVGEILWCDHSNEGTEKHFPVVLFIMLYKVVLTFESVDEILRSGHSN